MAKPTRRLGRGLDSLVSNLRPASGQDQVRPDPNSDALALGSSTAIETRMIPIGVLQKNPFQPRRTIDSESLRSLTESIRHTGILQPITVRRDSGRYQIVAGERRWRAAREAGLTHVPVIVRQATNEQMLELALVENLQREDLNAIDRANAYREFCQRFSLSVEAVAERLGEDRSTVANYVRLLDLELPIQDMVISRAISMGHARCLLGVSDSKRRMRLAASVGSQGWSVRALEAVVRRDRSSSVESTSEGHETSGPRDAHIRDLQLRFEEHLKSKVVIHEGKRKGTGRIVVHYYSLDDFDRISEIFGVRPENA